MTPRCSRLPSLGWRQAEAYAAELTPGLIERGVEIEEQQALQLEYA